MEKTKSWFFSKAFVLKYKGKDSSIFSLCYECSDLPRMLAHRVLSNVPEVQIFKKSYFPEKDIKEQDWGTLQKARSSATQHVQPWVTVNICSLKSNHLLRY